MDRERVKGLKKKLGANIKLARLRRGLTQEDAAERIGISTEVYGRLERGGIFPRVVRLTDICEQFGVSADQLLELAPAEPLLPMVEVPPKQDDWFLVMHRIMLLAPRLTQIQRLAARRQMSEFYRMLLTFVDPGAQPRARRRRGTAPGTAPAEPPAKGGEKPSGEYP
ncbi:MAG TPA: helix-turn-helix transcriptional regulator [Myxococcaceae bacterium]|nr:helix-turn-helix transcriptional regulator [Myxococcaceae bacterium]